MVLLYVGLQVSCDTFCLDSTEALGEVAQALDSEGITESNCRIVEDKGDSIIEGKVFSPRL